MKNRRTSCIVLCLLVFGQISAAAQITDTLSLSWETLPLPQKGIFTRCFQKADTLFGIRRTPYEVWQSTDQGLSWSFYQTNLQDFAATDSFIFYKNYLVLPGGGVLQNFEFRDNAGHVLALLPADNSVLQYSQGNVYYYNVTETKPFIPVDAQTIALYTINRQNVCQPGGCGTAMVYSRLLRISTRAGLDFRTFNLPVSGTYLDQPLFAVNGDSVAILDKGQLYLAPKTGLDLYSLGSVADHLPQQKITWTGDCLAIWGSDGYPQPNLLLRRRSFDRGLTWSLDTLPVALAQAQVTTCDTFVFLACPTGLYRSVNARADGFEQRYAGIPGTGPYVQSLLPAPPHLYAFSNNNRLLHSPDNGQSWAVASSPTTDDATDLPFVFDGKLNVVNQLSWYQWPDDQTPWQTREAWLPAKPLPPYPLPPPPMLRFGGYIWSGGDDSNVFRSADEGKTWQAIAVDPYYLNRKVNVTAAGSRLFADSDVRTWVSADTGASWQVAWPYQHPSRVLQTGDSALVYLDLYESNYVFKTTDFGQTHYPILHTNSAINSLYQLSAQQLLVMLENGITYASDDAGESWLQAGQPAPETPIAFSTVTDSLLFYWGASSLVSANRGVNYTAINLPVYGGPLYRLLPLDDYLYFVNNHQVFRTPLASLRQTVLTNSTKTGIFKGRVYFDADANCQPDSSELPGAARIIEFTPGPRSIATDPDGYFALSLPVGIWTATLASQRYYTVCPDTLLANFVVSADTVRSQNFGFQPIPNMYDASVALTPFTPVRPGFTVKYQINLKNQGTLPLQNDVLTCVFPADKLLYLQADPAPVYQNGDTLRWSAGTLPLFGETSFILDFKAHTNLPIGTEVKLSARLEPAQPDAFPADNYAESSQIATGSVDPNEKTVFPAGNFTATEQTLDYLIRFQNTGTDTAFQVRVVDTLDRDLHPLTLQMLDASHPYQLQLSENHIITWVFDHIMLPDSHHNEAASHGFLRFSIRSNAGVLPYAKITNSAAIYFDYNAPVLTNEVSNCVEKPVIWLDAEHLSYCAGQLWNFHGIVVPLLRDTVFVDQPYEDVTAIYKRYFYLTVNGYYSLQDTVLTANTLFDGQLVDTSWNGTVREVIHPAAAGCDSIWRYSVTVLPPVVATFSPERVDVTLFPNPANGQVHLLCSEGLFQPGLVVSVLDPLGRICKIMETTRAEERVLSLDLAGLPAGIYYVGLRLPDGRRMTRKLVLTK